jgi:hypothetical protein
MDPTASGTAHRHRGRWRSAELALAIAPAVGVWASCCCLRARTERLSHQLQQRLTVKYSVMVQRTTYSVQHSAYDRTVIHALAAQTLTAASAMAQQAACCQTTGSHILASGGRRWALTIDIPNVDRDGRAWRSEAQREMSANWLIRREGYLNQFPRRKGVSLFHLIPRRTTRVGLEGCSSE